MGVKVADIGVELARLLEEFRGSWCAACLANKLMARLWRSGEKVGVEEGGVMRSMRDLSGRSSGMYTMGVMECCNCKQQKECISRRQRG